MMDFQTTMGGGRMRQSVPNAPSYSSQSSAPAGPSLQDIERKRQEEERKYAGAMAQYQNTADIFNRYSPQYAISNLSREAERAGQDYRISQGGMWSSTAPSGGYLSMTDRPAYENFMRDWWRRRTGYGSAQELSGAVSQREPARQGAEQAYNQAQQAYNQAVANYYETYGRNNQPSGGLGIDIGTFR